jgi:hypothetical protein
MAGLSGEGEELKIRESAEYCYRDIFIRTSIKF